MADLILLRDFMESQIEFWLPIQGFKGYDVSSFGKVRSWLQRTGADNPRIGGGRHTVRYDKPPHLLRFGIHRQGYLTAYLYQLGGKRRQFPVHRLVATAFTPNPEGKEEINHVCGLKSDNRVDAIEWATPSENQQHAWRIGLKVRIKKPSYRPAQTKISNESVLQIRTRRAAGEACETLRREFGVTNGCISEIVTGKTFKDVGGPRTTKASLYMLSDDDVRRVRIRATFGWSFAELARHYKVNPSEISIAVHRKRRYANII